MLFSIELDSKLPTSGASSKSMDVEKLFGVYGGVIFWAGNSGKPSEIRWRFWAETWVEWFKQLCPEMQVFRRQGDLVACFCHFFRTDLIFAQHLWSSDILDSNKLKTIVSRSDSAASLNFTPWPCLKYCRRTWKIGAGAFHLWLPSSLAPSFLGSQR